MWARDRPSQVGIPAGALLGERRPRIFLSQGFGLAEDPESQARAEIDRLLTVAGWVVQRVEAVNLHAARGVAICEFPLKEGHGFADYLLYVDDKACGALPHRPDVRIASRF